MLARIPSTGLINRVEHFGEEFMLTTSNTMKLDFLVQRVPLCIGG